MLFVYVCICIYICVCTSLYIYTINMIPLYHLRYLNGNYLSHIVCITFSKIADHAYFIWVVYLVLHFITHVVFQHCIFRNYVNALYVKMCDVCIWKVYFKSSFESQYQVIGLYSMSVPSWFHTPEFKSLEKG